MPPDPEISLPPFIRPDLNQQDWSPNKLVDFHLEHNPTYPISILANISTPVNQNDNDMIRWNEAGKAIFVRAQELSKLWPVHHHVLQENRPVVGILSSGEPLAYFLTMLALMRLGYIPLAISPRNSSAAIAHLIQKTNCQRLLVDFDPRIESDASQKLERQQVKEFVNLLPEPRNLHLAKMPTAFDLFPRLRTGQAWNPNENDFDYHEYMDRSKPMSDQSPGALLILHSSGTTQLPKPIYLTKAHFQGALNVHKSDEFSWKAHITNMFSLPPYHSMGFNVGFYPPLAEGAISGLFLPQPTEDGVCQTPKINARNITMAMRKLKCTIGIFSPFTLHELSQDSKSVQVLKTMERVAFGGAPLRQEVGNHLVSQGVRLGTLYGMTEMGSVGKFFPANYEPDNWEYFQISPHVTANLVPHEENQFELTILFSEKCCPTMNVGEGEPNLQVFHTNDLLLKHPTLPLYRIIGRLDDQIMLSNSEKTNPAPLETILCTNEAIEGAVMFGRGKPQNGVILEPAHGFEVDVGDPEAVERYLDIIWPTVQEVNRFAPTHSRLIRSLILVIDPRVSPLPRTSKGISRARTVKAYEAQIEQIYRKAELGIESRDMKIITDFYNVEGEISESRIIVAVKSIAEGVFDHELDESEDLFKQGCDSIRAANIRSKICGILKSQRQSAARGVPSNLIYQEESILKLARWLKNRLSTLGNDSATEINESRLDSHRRLEKMNAMISKYKPKIPTVVLITGTTGSLGSYVLADVLQTRDVDRVYALNRTRAEGSPLERHTKSFEGRGLDIDMLQDSRLQFLEADRLDDLSKTQLSELSSSVTHVLHLSYPVEFNFSLESFENAIRLTAQLTQLFKNFLRSHVAKPTFVFASSVATLTNHSGPSDEWVKEAEVDSESSLGSGYGESKVVCEKIIEASAKAYGFRSIIVRIAQLCGSRNHGAWNRNEWFPLLVQSGSRLGCLPTGEDDIAWIPVDEAAMCFNDFAFNDRFGLNNDTCGPIYRHLVHPKPSSWHKIITRFHQLLKNQADNGSTGKLNLRIVSYSEWFERLSEIAQEERPNTEIDDIGALKLVDYFQRQLTHGGLHQTKPKGYEAMGVKRLETKLSEEESVHLKSCQPLSEQDVDLWFSYWMKVGLFKK